MRPRLLFFLLFLPCLACGQVKNGFDLRHALIPSDEILQGGPPRDGIPAIDKPQFISAAEANFPDSLRVLGVVLHGVAKAYPVNILNYHEIVNDQFKGKAVVVTYCPLCGSGIAFEAEIAGKAYTFGVSGLLYNSDVLLYDRQSESLWSQLMMQAVSGQLRGTALHPIPTQNTSWGSWKAQYPGSWVLSEHTGFSRDYSRNPYAGYAQGRALYFAVSRQDKRYHPKALVIGLELEGKAKVYPFSELAAEGAEVIQDHFQQQAIYIHYEEASKSARIVDEAGNELPAVTTFWFAWYAFHPDTEVYTAAE